jgi:iron complex outermembrane recepter protein
MRGISSVRRRLPLCPGLDGAVLLLLVLSPGVQAMQDASISLIQQGRPESGMPARLAPLGLERLMEIEVTTVSRKPEKVAEAPAAIYVLTGDDIRRLGVTNIPDALRYVPGVDVARIDSHKFAVSARGFNSEWVSKLQVLIDGRSVYGPLFSGERWDEKDVLLEDIDRIEVIRGPGSTLWGADAVNGVINIITKSTVDTQGWLATAGGGVREQGFAGLRYGGQFGKDRFFRFYA